MPSSTLTINYTAGEGAEILEAIRENFSMPPEATNAEVIAKLKDVVLVSNIRDMVQRRRVRIATEAAMASLPPPIIVT